MAQVIDPDQVRELTREVLGRPEFTESERRAALMKQLIDWIREFGLPAIDPDLVRVVIYVLLCGLVVVIAYLVYQAVKGMRDARTISSIAAPHSVSRALEGVAQDWNGALRMAREALAAGDAYRAIWIAHRLLLDSLDRAGAIRFSKWKTNSDYLRECAAQPSAHGTLTEVTGVYDSVVYAHREASLEKIGELLNKVALRHAS